MSAEAALVRIQLVSGTAAIATALFAVLRPGDELLAVAGRRAPPAAAQSPASQLAVDSLRAVTTGSLSMPVFGPPL